jgi:murein DD-endopeptidase MepM/ murein hydrolase activator NlpD
MAISSPILNVKNAPKKTDKISVTSSTIKNIQETLIKQGKVRKEILDRKKQFNIQRIENEKRRRMEDELEAANLVIKPSGPIQMIQSSTKGFLERILGFLSYLTAGWLMNNLPTWIAMGKEFIGRVQRMGQLVNGFMTNITNIFSGFGNLLSATFQNLIQFDLFDSSNRMKDAFGQLTGSVDDMGRELEEAIRLITTPLTEGMVTGEDAPPTGTQRTSEGAYEPGAPLQGGGGLPDPKSAEMYRIAAALSTEGSGSQSTVDMMQVVVNRKASGKYGSSYTEILSRPNQFKGVEKKGVGGFKKIQTLQDASKWSGQSEATLLRIIRDIQDPSLQSSAAKYVGGAFEFRAAPQYYLKYGLVPGEMGPDGRFYGSGWRGGPGDNQFLKDPIRDRARINPAGPAPFNLPKPTQQSQTSTSPQVIQGTGQYFKPLPQGSFKGGESQGYLAPRPGRKHLGIDITESNWKRGTDPRIPVVAIRGGVVSSSRYYKPGTEYDSGMMIDQDDGYSIRYLHMTPSVRPGQKVSAGQRIGRLVDLGDQTHLHIELFSGSKRLDPTSYINTIEKGGVPRAIARQQPSPEFLIQSQPEPQLGSRDSSGKFYTGRKYGYQSWESVKKNRLLRPEILVDSPSRVPPSVLPAAQIASSQTQQQRQQVSQQLSQDRTGPTVIFQQPPESEPQGPSYSAGAPSMMPLQVDEFTLVNNFMKKKLLLDLAYL